MWHRLHGYLPSALVFSGLVILVVLSQLLNYLFFHTVVEVFSIIVCMSIFIFSWNTRKISNNPYLVFLGLAYLSVGIIDLFHTLSYKGMNIIPGLTTNVPTQLWIGQRYLLALSLLIGTALMVRKVNEYMTVTFFTVITLVLLLSVYYFKIFPASYIDGIGLTEFKKISEYLIALIFMASALILWLKRDRFERKIFKLLFFSYILSALCEFLFTLYSVVNDGFNMLGHMVQLLAFSLVYVAILEEGLTKPYNLLFLELKKINQQKDDFLNMTSHEIKNPLTSIKLMAELMARHLTKLGDTSSLNKINAVEAEVDKINYLVNDLLDVNRIESGKFTYTPSSFPINDLVKEIIHSLRYVLHSHVVITQYAPQNIQVKGDRQRLGQVLSNLLTNAAKYSAKGEQIRVAVAVNAQNVTISVKDGGIGIAKKHLAHVFEKYFRTPNSEKTAAGLGLGLYISHEIVAYHKGKIWAESEIGKGSTFYVALPRGSV